MAKFLGFQGQSSKNGLQIHFVRDDNFTASSRETFKCHTVSSKPASPLSTVIYSAGELHMQIQNLGHPNRIQIRSRFINPFPTRPCSYADVSTVIYLQVESKPFRQTDKPTCIVCPPDLRDIQWELMKARRRVDQLSLLRRMQRGSGSHLNTTSSGNPLSMFCSVPGRTV